MFARNVMRYEATIRALMSVTPWKRGWLEYNIQTGWMRWLSSLTISVNSVVTFAGMTAVTYRAFGILPTSVVLLNTHPISNSGYRHASGSLLSVTWLPTLYPTISSSKSVTHLLECLDEQALAASPILRALHHELAKRTGRKE